MSVQQVIGNTESTLLEKNGATDMNGIDTVSNTTASNQLKSNGAQKTPNIWGIIFIENKII